MSTEGKGYRIPDEGQAVEVILKEIHRIKQSDLKWADGKMLGYVYGPDETALSMLQEIARTYMFENALNATVFPSLAYFEREVVSTVAEFLHGDSDVRGNVSSGGTESILLALKSARNYMRELKPGLREPEVILPVSVHPAFHKATDVLQLREITLPLDEDYRADVSKLESLISERTILIVGSAPSYPHGVMDPIDEMAGIAQRHDILFHVDACLGGLFLPFMKMLGYPVPPFDFSVPGVTSMSADTHKFGYGIKGTSVILHRKPETWRKQFFVDCSWPAGMFGTPTMLGSRSGVPVVSAWAMMQFFGQKGFLDMTRSTMDAVERLKNGIMTIPGIYVAGDPMMGVLAITSDELDIFRIGEELEKNGWVLDRLMHPKALHIIFSYRNIAQADCLVSDLAAVVENCSGKGVGSFIEDLKLRLAKRLMTSFPRLTSTLVASMASKSSRKTEKVDSKGSAVFYGIAASTDGHSNLDRIVLEFLEKVYAPVDRDPVP